MKFDWEKQRNWIGYFFIAIAAVLAANRVGEFFGLDKETWAAWVQAVGSIIAIIAAVKISTAQQSANKRQSIEADAAAVLSLQMIANELARMCTLSMGQATGSLDGIYPDLPAEFAAINELLFKLPIEKLAARNCMFILLDLRRVAVEFELIMRSAPEAAFRTDAFYLKHRRQAHGSVNKCRKHSIALAEMVEKIAPGVYQTANHL
jgi:hypothetical protein